MYVGIVHNSVLFGLLDLFNMVGEYWVSNIEYSNIALLFGFKTAMSE